MLNAFRATCVLAVFLGTLSDFSLVWNIADITMGLMAIVNIIAIFLLRGIVFKVLKDYENQKRDGKEPAFCEESVGLQGTVWTTENRKEGKLDKY